MHSIDCVPLEEYHRCPPDPEQVAEAYVMETLAEAAVGAFEKHLLVCPDCRAAVDEADGFARAMAEAARQVRAIGC